jgi:hypothetical protein
MILFSKIENGLAKKEQAKKRTKLCFQMPIGMTETIKVYEAKKL